MKYLTIDDIKAQLRLDYDEETKILDLYGNSAEETVLNVLNRSYMNLVDEFGVVPDPVIQATLLLVSHSYIHREPASMQNIYAVPYTFDLLLKPYIRLTGPICEEEEAEHVTLGSDVKIAFTAELPDELTLKDIDFEVTAYNANQKGMEITFGKGLCVEAEDNLYVIQFNSEVLGAGMYMLKIMCKIPDEDFASGYRKEVVRFNPKVIVGG